MPDITNPSSEDIKTAMLRSTPILFNGIDYRRIRAYIVRYLPERKNLILEVELESKVGNSVTIANPKQIIIKERDFNERVG